MGGLCIDEKCWTLDKPMASFSTCHRPLPWKAILSNHSLYPKTSAFALEGNLVKSFTVPENIGLCLGRQSCKIIHCTRKHRPLPWKAILSNHSLYPKTSAFALEGNLVKSFTVPENIGLCLGRQSCKIIHCNRKHRPLPWKAILSNHSLYPKTSAFALEGNLVKSFTVPENIGLCLGRQSCQIIHCTRKQNTPAIAVMLCLRNVHHQTYFFAHCLKSMDSNSSRHLFVHLRYCSLQR